MNILLIAAALLGQRDPDWRPDNYVEVGAPKLPVKVEVQPRDEVKLVPKKKMPVIPTIEVLPMPKPADAPARKDGVQPRGANQNHPPIPLADSEETHVAPTKAETLGAIPNSARTLPAKSGGPTENDSQIVEARTPRFSGLYRPDSEQLAIRALWPSEVEFPEGLEFYRGTKYAQSTAVTDFPQQGQYNVLTHEWIRSNPEPKYSRPGGTLEVEDLRPYSGVVRGTPIYSHLQTFPFSGAFGGFLRKKTWTFSEGTTFVSLLVTPKGEPFIIRSLTKRANGTWKPSVVFRDERYDPPGFKNLPLRACVGCHRDAGSAAYGAGLRGSDGIFSFPAKEKGLFP